MQLPAQIWQSLSFTPQGGHPNVRIFPQTLVAEMFSIFRRNQLPAKTSYYSKSKLMHHQCPIPTLLFFFLSTIAQSGHTQPTNNNASTILTSTTNTTTIPSPIQTSPTINSIVICTPFSRLQFRPKYQDCNAALDFLPDSQKLGLFHTGGLADEFRLPVHATARTCEIKVQLVESYEGRELGTWTEVRATAAMVADECYYGHGMEHTGGETLLRRNILISLVRTGSVILSGVGNATIAGEN